MLQHLEQTVQNYEMQLNSSIFGGRKVETVRASKKPLSEVGNQASALNTDLVSPSSALDPERHQKLQQIMKRIKDDIG